MTTSEQRAELVRRADEVMPFDVSESLNDLISALRDALEASEAEKARLIEAVRFETANTEAQRLVPGCVWRLDRACAEAEAQ